MREYISHESDGSHCFILEIDSNLSSFTFIYIKKITMFFIKLFSLNESLFLYFPRFSSISQLSRILSLLPFFASHKACYLASLLLLVSPNHLTHDIPTRPHRWHSNSWYRPGIYLKMSVSPPPVSVCARRGGDRAGKTARREGAAEHCSADKWMHHWWLSQQPTPSLAYCLHQLCLRRNNMHAVNTYTHALNMPLAWSKTHRAFHWPNYKCAL